MDSPGIIDEVIADSEGELDEEEHPGNGGLLIIIRGPYLFAR